VIAFGTGQDEILKGHPTTLSFDTAIMGYPR